MRKYPLEVKADVDTVNLAMKFKALTAMVVSSVKAARWKQR